MTDIRRKFWQTNFDNTSYNDGGGRKEYGVNLYTRRGWNARLKLFRAKITRLIKSGDLNDDSKASDLGCGTGAYSRILQENGIDVVSLDLCKGMLEYAGFRTEEPNFVQADCCDTPFKNEFFDFIVSIGVVTIITERYRYYSELKRVTKPSSSIILSTLHKGYIVDKLKRFFKIKPPLRPDISIIKFSIDELGKDIKKYFPDRQVSFTPIFIFHWSLFFLQPILQLLKPLYGFTSIFASALMVEIKPKSCD